MKSSYLIVIAHENAPHKSKLCDSSYISNVEVNLTSLSPVAICAHSHYPTLHDELINIAVAKVHYEMTNNAMCRRFGCTSLTKFSQFQTRRSYSLLQSGKSLLYSASFQ